MYIAYVCNSVIWCNTYNTDGINKVYKVLLYIVIDYHSLKLSSFHQCEDVIIPVM